MTLRSRNLLHELCLALVNTYVESGSDNSLGHLLRFVQDADPATKFFVEARCAIRRDQLSFAISNFASWIRTTIDAFGQTPDALDFYDTIANLNWIEDDADLESLKNIVFQDVIKCFDDRWPASAISYTAKACLHEFDDLQDGVDLLKAALDLDPNFWPARLQLAHYCELVKRTDDACHHFAILDKEGLLMVNFMQHGKAWASCAARCGDLLLAEQIANRLSKLEPQDGDYDAFLANTKFDMGDVTGAMYHLNRSIPYGAHRSFWLWVTRPAYYLEEDCSERYVLDPLELRGSFAWSCEGGVKEGDLILLYRTSPKTDIAYILTALSDAVECSDGDWDFECTVRPLRKLRPAITLASLRNEASLKNLTPLKTNFQGSSFKISRDEFVAILSLGEKSGDTEVGWESIIRY